MEQEYEALVRKRRVENAIRTGIITILFCFGILMPAEKSWEASIVQQDALRAAKNVVLNLELLSIVYRGVDSGILDNTRESGLKEKVERDAFLYSGAEGEFRIIAWDAKTSKVKRFEYRQDGYVLLYSYDVLNEHGTWTVYREIKKYEFEK